MNPDRQVRRCVCHKFVIHVERDDNGRVVKRFCQAVFPWKEISKDQTYLATWGSEEEIQPRPKATAERGCKVDD